MNTQITVEVDVKAPLSKVWQDFVSPEAIVVWNTASPDWHTPRAENDVRVGGRFTSRMEARDGSIGFDFSGEYTAVVPEERLAYVLEDGRTVTITFTPESEGVRVTETFDPETENTPELQRTGWQAILDNFKRYVEQ